MDLREILEEYKCVSLKLIKEIKKDANIEELMEKRDILIREIIKIELSKEEKVEIGKVYNILQLECSVKEALEEEQRKVKDEIREMNIKKQANRGYGKNINSINFFNTKV